MSLQDSLIDLNDTLNKDDGIVNTSSATRFKEHPGEIETQYREYARTHLVQPDISSFIDTLIDSLEDDDETRSIPGYIVGPYGYGKTSTAGKVWHTLEVEKEYIATPPIYFDELQSIVEAVYGWMRYRLSDREDFLDELEEKYQAKVANNVDDLVDDRDIDDKESLKSEIQRLIDEGSIEVDFSVNNVLEFLSECNQIAKEAGYNGLVVIADELQQFVSSHSSDKEAYSELRDIAKSIALGLNEGDGLSLIFTMDDGLHSDLNVNADDVLARLAEQNVKLNLTSVYDREFPANLWANLSETYGFYDQRFEVISEDTLDAIGQLCERGPPISNGPRSVVDLLTLGIDHWLGEGEPFTALDLADAYYKGTVRYKGEKIKTAITEGINADIVNTTDRENFIKLCGVFPRGVPDELLKKYGVFKAKEEVKNDLHGQLIITHEEGRTLKSLEREGEDRGLKDELFTQFYQKYDTTDIYDEQAANIFRDQVLEEHLFPAKRGKTLNSWVTEHDFEPETDGVYTAIFHGSFDSQGYPKRYLQVKTGPTKSAVKASDTVDDKVDMKMGFVLGMDGDQNLTPQISRPATDEVILELDFLDAFDQLPSNISILESYMSPEDVNPHLLLSLFKFMETWEEDHQLNPSQEDQLEFIRDQLVNQSIQKLFGSPINDDDFLDTDGSDRRTIQPTKVIEEVFSKAIEEIYPNYNTLYISNNYETFLDDYVNMLTSNDPSLRISQKRGNTPIEGSKSEISNVFGVSNNSTAKTRIQKQYSSLATLEYWEGSEARVRVELHPLEDQILSQLEDEEDEQLTNEEAYEIGAELGHREEEVDWALKILEGRQYVERHPKENYIELDDIAIDPEEVKSRWDDLDKDLEKTQTIADSWGDYSELRTQLDDIKSDLDTAKEEDIELLDERLADLTDIEAKIKTKLNGLQATYRERCRSKKEDLQTLSSRTEPRDLKKNAEGAKVPFAMHLDDIQTHLQTEFKKTVSRAEDAETQLRNKINSAEGTPSTESIETLQTALAETKEVEDEIQDDFEDIESRAADYASWCTLAAEMSDERRDMVRYIDNHNDAERASSLLDQLDDLLEEIQGEFQSDGEQTLRNAEVHRESFEDINDEFQEIVEGDRDIFTYRKNILENTISEATTSHGRIRTNLDPEDPQQSRKDLAEEFRRLLRENDSGIQDTLTEIDSVENNLGYADLLNHIPEDGLDTEDKEALAALKNRTDTPVVDAADIQSTLEEHLAVIKRDLEALDMALNTFDTTDDINLPDDEERSDAFPMTDETLSIDVRSDHHDIGDFLTTRRDEVDTIGTVISQWRKTTDEPPEELQKITQELDYRSETDIEKVILEVAKKNGGDLDLGEFFGDIQTLFEDNHVTIKLSSQHR